MRISWVAITLFVVIGLSLSTSGAQAAPAVASSAAIASEVSSFRHDVSGLLNSYFKTYGSRLNSSEKTQMTGLIAQVDKDLAQLHRKSKSSAQLARTHAPQTKQKQAARDLSMSYDTAYAKAIASLEQVQPILGPKLSLFEALKAKSDLEQSMQQFELLGSQIHQAAR